MQLLNDNERDQSHHKLAIYRSQQLDDILSQIEKLEQTEHAILAQQSYAVLGTQAAHSESLNTSRNDASRPLLPKPSANLGLTLPLSVVAHVKIPKAEEKHEMCSGPLETRPAAMTKHTTNMQEIFSARQAATIPPIIKTSIVQGKTLQSIEKRRSKFLRHRQLVEAALSDTGMAQFAVIEMYGLIFCLVWFGVDGSCLFCCADQPGRSTG